MNRLLKTVGQIFAFATLTAACAPEYARIPVSDASASRIEPLTVMSYNVQCALCNVDRPWPGRLAEFTHVIAHHMPDIIAAQELIIPLDAEHFRLALPRPAGVAEPVYESLCRVNCDSTIYYRKDRLRSVASGAVWLSSWPYRYAAWAVFEELAGGARFLLVNAHFDNHQPNQSRSAKILKGALADWLQAGLPMIVAGDFNSSPNGRAFVHEGHVASAEAYAILDEFLVNTFDRAERCAIYTNHPEPASNPLNFESAIDHIFVSPGPWRVADWGIDYWWTISDHSPRAFYPSDHWPVIARLSYEPGRAASVTVAAASPGCTPRLSLRE